MKIRISQSCFQCNSCQVLNKHMDNYVKTSVSLILVPTTETSPPPLITNKRGVFP